MSHNTWIHQIIRPGVRLIAPTGVTPNQLTTARLLSGLAAAALYAGGPGFWSNLAGFVFIASMLLDRADGELARQTGQMSLAGYRYDLWSDCLASMTTFIGIGTGLSGADTWMGSLGIGSAGLWFGIVAGLSIAILFWQLNVAKIAPVQGFSFFGGRLTVDPDDGMILVPVLIWLGFAQPMLILAATVTPLAAMWIGYTALRGKT